MSAQAFFVFLQIRLELMHLAQHAACMVQKRLARRRQAHPTSLPVKQRLPGLALKGFDAHTGRRQGHVLQLGSAGQAAFVSGTDKKPKVCQIKVHGGQVRA